MASSGSPGFWEAKAANYKARAQNVDAATRKIQTPDFSGHDTLCEVLPKLYLSSHWAEHNKAKLNNRGISHILQVAYEASQSHPECFNYRSIHAYDLEEQDLVACFKECFDFIEQGREEGGVLVHCVAGVSRSAALVIGYVMWKRHVSFADARALVKLARPAINPNLGFVVQLQLFEQAGCSWAGWQPWGMPQFLVALEGCGDLGGLEDGIVSEACRAAPPRLGFDGSDDGEGSGSSRPQSCERPRGRSCMEGATFTEDVCTSYSPAGLGNDMASAEAHRMPSHDNVIGKSSAAHQLRPTSPSAIVPLPPLSAWNGRPLRGNCSNARPSHTGGATHSHIPSGPRHMQAHAIPDTGTVSSDWYSNVHGTTPTAQGLAAPRPLTGQTDRHISGRPRPARTLDALSSPTSLAEAPSPLPPLSQPPPPPSVILPAINARPVRRHLHQHLQQHLYQHLQQHQQQHQQQDELQMQHTSAEGSHLIEQLLMAVIGTAASPATSHTPGTALGPTLPPGASATAPTTPTTPATGPKLDLTDRKQLLRALSDGGRSEIRITAAVEGSTSDSAVPNQGQLLHDFMGTVGGQELLAAIEDDAELAALVRPLLEADQHAIAFAASRDPFGIASRGSSRSTNKNHYIVDASSNGSSQSPGSRCSAKLRKRSDSGKRHGSSARLQRRSGRRLSPRNSGGVMPPSCGATLPGSRCGSPEPDTDAEGEGSGSDDDPVPLASLAHQASNLCCGTRAAASLDVPGSQSLASSVVHCLEQTLGRWPSRRDTAEPRDSRPPDVTSHSVSKDFSSRVNSSRVPMSVEAPAPRLPRIGSASQPPSLPALLPSRPPTAQGQAGLGGHRSLAQLEGAGTGGMAVDSCKPLGRPGGGGGGGNDAVGTGGDGGDGNTGGAPATRVAGVNGSGGVAGGAGAGPAPGSSTPPLPRITSAAPSRQLLVYPAVSMPSIVRRAPDLS